MFCSMRVLCVCLALFAGLERGASTELSEIQINLKTCGGVKMLVEYEPGECAKLQGGVGFFDYLPSFAFYLQCSKSGVDLSASVFLSSNCKSSLGSVTASEGSCESMKIIFVGSLMVTNVKGYATLPPPTPQPEADVFGSVIADGTKVFINEFALDIGFGTSCETNVMQLDNYVQGSCMSMTDFVAAGGGSMPKVVYGKDLWVSVRCWTQGLVYTVSSADDCSHSTMFETVPATFPYNYRLAEGHQCQQNWFSSESAPSGTTMTVCKE